MAICTKSRKLCSHLQCRGEGGAAPFKKDDVILRARPQTAWRPKNLVTTELFLGRRGAGDVVCTAPTQLKVYEYENHCVVQNYTVTFYIILPIKSSNNYVSFKYPIMHIKPLRTGTAPRL